MLVLLNNEQKNFPKNSNFFMFEEKLKKIVERFDFLEKEMQRNLDRITFEEIFRKVGKTESDVIKLMRKKLRPSSFKLWRKRVRHQSIKNEKMFLSH